MLFLIRYVGEIKSNIDNLPGAGIAGYNCPGDEASGTECSARAVRQERERWAMKPAATTSHGPFFRIALGIGDFLSVAVLLVVAAYAVFRLPYHFPSSVPTASQSYMVGFNNRVAVMAIVAVVVLFCIRNLAWRRATPEPVDQLFAADQGGSGRVSARMPISIVLLLIAIQLGIAFLIYTCIPYLNEYGEPEYMLPRIEQAMQCHLHLYSEMDWPFGPGLFYFPVACITVAGWFGIGPHFAYMLSYSCISIAAIVVLYYVVNSLRLKVADRIVLFSIFALCFCNISLGIQYTALRYAPPYAAILLLHQVSTRMPPEKDRRSLFKLCGLCFLCASFVLSISIEQGIACIIGLCVYCMHRAIFSSRLWLCLALAAVVALPLLLVCFPDCIHELEGYAKGGANFPVIPSAYIVFYVLTLFWLLPILLRPGLLLRRRRVLPWGWPGRPSWC